MSKNIGVLGCGWLGFPLAKSLLENSYQVFGTTTSKEKLSTLHNAGITPYLIKLSEESIDGDIAGFLNQLDTLIIDVPPKLRGKSSENFVQKIELLLTEIKKSPVKNVIFVSSTSVYGNEQGEVDEQSRPEPSSESGRQLLACEALLRTEDALHTTVIRFGGLIGPGRHPVTMLSGKESLSKGNDPVNLIHLDDCILLITTILNENYWDETFNGVYPLHPPKREYYTKEAEKRGIPPPKYVPTTSIPSGKIVHGKNFMDKGHHFKTSIAG